METKIKYIVINEPELHHLNHHCTTTQKINGNEKSLSNKGLNNTEPPEPSEPPVFENHFLNTKTAEDNKKSEKWWVSGSDMEQSIDNRGLNGNFGDGSEVVQGGSEVVQKTDQDDIVDF